ncbi:MAG TPA: DUF1080 domain-containing protein [Bryobacteraceae bacterium]|nr:DUF1080 domain-containing protein [Bryobacteraceae bacterium]
MIKTALSLLTCATLVLAAGPRLGPKEKLFNGKSLDGFYTYIEKYGKNNDPKGVFRVENGQIRASGEEYGYFITEKEYEDYYLLVEFRWGSKTFPPREGNARDSGILYHAGGEDKLWPQSIEFQMIEGGTGDLILVGDTAVTVKGETKRRGRFDRFGKGKWEDVAGYRDPNGDPEKPHGQWNKLELWADGDNFRFLVNGKLVNEGSKSSVTRGKILFQSEGAEVFFRKIELQPILGR